MKKLFLFIGLLTVSFVSINAQESSKHAIGIRFSDNNGIGGEISYQQALKNNNRLEINLGLANEFSNFKATGLYEWVWQLENQFNWYAGAGAGLLSDGGAAFYGAGIIGIEYNFNIPLLISIDYRPEFYISGGVDGLYSDIAISLRYQF